jgi:hypothetical protein
MQLISKELTMKVSYAMYKENNLCLDFIRSYTYLYTAMVAI